MPGSRTTGAIPRSATSSPAQSALTLYPKATGATRNRQVIVPTQAIINHAASLGWCSPIIPGERRGAERVFQYLDAQNVKQVWEAAIKRAGIARLTPHSCRHGFATTLLRKGHDVKTVARMGGWKDAATVLKFYAHAVEDTTVTEAIFDTNPAQSAGRKTARSGKQRRIVS